MSILNELLNNAVTSGASDIHLSPGQSATFRIDGTLQDGFSEPLGSEMLNAILEDMLPAHCKEIFETAHEADFAHVEDQVGRFRVNAFMSSGLPTFAFRHVKDKVPDFEDLSLPPALKQLSLTRRGIMLITGTTGSGKSSTLAAIINHINNFRNERIITIEDPVEYLFSNINSIISQREIGIDTLNFNAALTHVLRQDPDVIMIGEMRNAESFAAALSAAETGHLVLTTLHTNTAGQAPGRILDFFPASEREQIRLSLADNLHSVICQRLVPAIAGGVVPAVEIMVNNLSVREMIEKNELDRIPLAIENGGDVGMQSFNQSVYKLATEGIITNEQALANAGNAEALKMNLKGIFLDESKRILK